MATITSERTGIQYCNNALEAVGNTPLVKLNKVTDDSKVDPDAFGAWNYMSSIGAYISAAGVIAFIVGVAQAFIRKRRAGADPWGAGASTLEWTLPSPPPFHTFDKLPRIR